MRLQDLLCHKSIGKREILRFFAVVLGISLFTPILPWTGRYNYRPVWESIDAVAASIDQNTYVDPNLLKRKYLGDGFGEKEAKCLTARDSLFSILVSIGVTQNDISKNLGFRSTSVPIFWIANAIALSIITEISTSAVYPKMTQEVADKCKGFPGRFISPSRLSTVMSDQTK